MDSNMESHITEFRNYLKTSLEPFKSAPQLWDHLDMIPAMKKNKDAIKQWEEKTKPVDWAALDSWIEKAINCFRDEICSLKSVLLYLGYSEAEIDMGNLVKVGEMVKTAPKIKRFMPRLFGPNWAVSIGKLKNTINTPNTNGNSLDSLRKAASSRGIIIMEHWGTLRMLQEEGALVRFRELWRQKETMERSTWLQEQFPLLPSRPHAVLRTWAESSELERTKLPPSLFLMSLLDLESLRRYGPSGLPRCSSKPTPASISLDRWCFRDFGTIRGCLDVAWP